MQKNYQMLFFDRKRLSLKAVFKVKKKKNFSNANLVLEIFQVKLLPELNKQVGGVISNAFFSKQILTLLAAIYKIKTQSVFYLLPQNWAQ